MSGFDIAVQKDVAALQDDGTFVHLNGLDDMPMYTEGEDPQPIGITVAGIHSRRHRQIEAQLRKRKIRPKDLTGERIMQDTIERVAYCTLGWQGFYLHGEEIPATMENVKMVYETFPWILDQVTEAMQDGARFFKKDSTS